MFINEKTGSIRRSMLHINVTNAITVFCALWVEGYRTGSASDRERLARNNISILSSLHDELHCLVLPVATAPGSVFVVPRQSTVGQKNHFGAKPLFGAAVFNCNVTRRNTFRSLEPWVTAGDL